MSKPLADRIPFKKIMTILSICIGVSLGLCGVGAAVGGGMAHFKSSGSDFVFSLFLIPGGILFWISLLGFVLLFLLWFLLSIVKAVSSR